MPFSNRGFDFLRPLQDKNMCSCLPQKKVVAATAVMVTAAAAAVMVTAAATTAVATTAAAVVAFALAVIGGVDFCDMKFVFEPQLLHTSHFAPRTCQILCMEIFSNFHRLIPLVNR